MKILINLTPRESEILHLVMLGLTNKAIAAELHVSEKTVQFHLDHVYEKSGARTRLMAVLWAIRQGLSEETRETPS